MRTRSHEPTRQGETSYDKNLFFAARRLYAHGWMCCSEDYSLLPKTVSWPRYEDYYVFWFHPECGNQRYFGLCDCRLVLTVLNKECKSVSLSESREKLERFIEKASSASY